jgi:hypothetical protein
MHDTNHHHPSTTAEQTENWDDDFDAEARNNWPRRPKLCTPRRQDVREESWDDELEMEVKCDKSDHESGRRDSTKLTREGFGFLPPLYPSSSSLVVDDGTYGRWFSYLYSCSTVLIVVVIALRLATVSLDKGMSQTIVHFPATVVTPKQVCLAPGGCL